MKKWHRFVRILPITAIDPLADKGDRIRLDCDIHGDGGQFVLADEHALPEKIFDPDANNVSRFGNIELDRLTVEWLRDALAELLDHLEKYE